MQDSFPHEQKLMVSENDVHVLLSGCSHGSILHIPAHCRQRTGIIPDRVVGGFHLFNPCTGTSVESSVLEELVSCRTIYHTCHCTGMTACGQLHVLMGMQSDTSAPERKSSSELR